MWNKKGQRGAPNFLVLHLLGAMFVQGGVQVGCKPDTNGADLRTSWCIAMRMVQGRIANGANRYKTAKNRTGICFAYLDSGTTLL
ncbi:hypothetical protein [Oxalicibacterium solurbis]|uniref:hypothetical protein n=1 Tax=Oxalicibacterium solurbis TaxID=69280 RepID=UPI001664015E|nr:hypothetical protein [Oxalicibacterium solurbis]